MDNKTQVASAQVGLDLNSNVHMANFLLRFEH
jgi:hypothetical protein